MTSPLQTLSDSDSSDFFSESSVDIPEKADTTTMTEEAAEFKELEEFQKAEDLKEEEELKKEEELKRLAEEEEMKRLKKEEEELKKEALIEVYIKEETILFDNGYIGTEIRNTTTSQKIKSVLKSLFVIVAPVVTMYFAMNSQGSNDANEMPTGAAIKGLAYPASWSSSMRGEGIRTPEPELRQVNFRIRNQYDMQKVVSIVAVVLILAMYLRGSMNSIFRTRYKYVSSSDKTITTNYVTTKRNFYIKTDKQIFRVKVTDNKNIKINGETFMVTVDGEVNSMNTLKTATLKIPFMSKVVPREVIALAATVNYVRRKTRFINIKSSVALWTGKALTYVEYAAIAGVLLVAIYKLSPDIKPKITALVRSLFSSITKTDEDSYEE
jgi:hypothetical protein